MNNFEKIKSMTLDEMAKHHALFARAVIEGFTTALSIELTGEVPIEVSIKNQKQWLQAESEEE